MTPSDQKNAQIVEDVRNTFAPVLEQLTPEIEPATVLLLSCDEGDKDE